MKSESEMTVEEWIKFHTNKHLCACGCGEYIVIKAHHHEPKVGIPKYINGHNMKMDDSREKARIKCLKRLESGNLKPFTGQEMKGRHHSEETKEKQSKSRKEWIRKNYDLFHKITIENGEKRQNIKKPKHSEFMKNYYLNHDPPMKGRHHSIESRIKNSCSRRGITIDEFNSFSEPEKRKIMYSIEYANWRKSVFERDNYTCRECGIRGGGLNAHYILPYRDWKDLALNPKNGITLCESCHRETYGKEYEFFSKYFDLANGIRNIDLKQ